MLTFKQILPNPALTHLPRPWLTGSGLIRVGNKHCKKVVCSKFSSAFTRFILFLITDAENRLHTSIRLSHTITAAHMPEWERKCIRCLWQLFPKRDLSSHHHCLPCPKAFWEHGSYMKGPLGLEKFNTVSWKRGRLKCLLLYPRWES